MAGHLASFIRRQDKHSFSWFFSFIQKDFSKMIQYPIRYAFRLDPATEAGLEQSARHTFQSKASIKRRYVEEGVRREAEVYSEGAAAIKHAAHLL